MKLFLLENRKSNFQVAIANFGRICYHIPTFRLKIDRRCFHVQKRARFRVSDNYVRFYLHYIEPRREAVARGLFEFSSVEQLPGLHAFYGLQFENLVLNHINDLFPLLGIDKSLVLSAFPYVQAQTKQQRGCQIDLLIQTQRTLIVVEIKRRLEIGYEVVEEVAEKMNRLVHDKTLSVRTALVYDGRLSPRIEADRFFDFIIPADRLF